MVSERKKKNSLLLEGPLHRQRAIFGPSWVTTLLEESDVRFNDVFQHEVLAVNATGQLWYEASPLLFAEGTFPVMALSVRTKG